MVVAEAGAATIALAPRIGSGFRPATAAAHTIRGRNAFGSGSNYRKLYDSWLRERFDLKLPASQMGRRPGFGSGAFFVFPLGLAVLGVRPVWAYPLGPALPRRGFEGHS